VMHQTLEWAGSASQAHVLCCSLLACRIFWEVGNFFWHWVWIHFLRLRRQPQLLLEIIYMSHQTYKFQEQTRQGWSSSYMGTCIVFSSISWPLDKVYVVMGKIKLKQFQKAVSNQFWM
jgi:hypothetical protein